jgi:hypothetical protein
MYRITVSHIIFSASKIDHYAFIFYHILAAELLYFVVEEVLPQLHHYNTVTSLI